MKCPKCHTDNPDGVRFCGECGHPLLSEFTCPTCGHKNPTNVKFCHECGSRLLPQPHQPDVLDTTALASLATPSDTETKPTYGHADEDAQSEQHLGAYQLGKALEDTVVEILQAEGYSTDRRRRLPGEKGTSEIDITARKGRRQVIAVECKNLNFPVPVKEVRDFISKLEDLNIKSGIFAARPGFSSQAFQWGQNFGLELWDENVLKEKHWELAIARLGPKELDTLQYYLPLKLDYDQAVNLDLENKQNVQIETAKLIWKPFYKVFFTLRCIRTLPNKEKRTLQDSGFYVLDGLSSDTPQPSQGLKNIVNRILRQSDQETHQIKETDAFFGELEQEPNTGLNLTHSDLHKTIIHKPPTTQEEAKAMAFDAIVKDNTQQVSYEVWEDEADLFPSQREFVIKPSSKDIRITDVQLIYAPKWEVEFTSKDYKYTRKITGNSATTIYDTITYCTKHWFAGRRKKKNTAVCDFCGEALCKEHIWKCPTCGSWRCETHSNSCTSCHKRYCPEHIPNKCTECGNPVCDSCTIKCPICGEIHCKAHITKCSNCHTTVCLSCTRKEGGILSFRQKVYCKNCQPR
jgi:hypothetical protein